jgi:hypothetical protein
MVFFFVSVSILLFLFLAPKETTSRLPHDGNHNKFHAITDKKEAEKGCAQCHNASGISPLAQDHPDPYRCLFCHKRQ